MIKNIFAIGLIALSVVACKKETKTVTRVNPETGKTETVEVEVAKEEEKPAVIPAIKDSLGVYTLQFKLEKGKTYPLVTYQKDVQTLTDPSGKSVSGTQEMTDEMSFTVDNFDKGIYDISINLLGKKNVSNAQGKSITVDTKAAQPKEEQLKMMWNINKALVGNKLAMKMDQTGKVLSVTGFEPVYTKVNTVLTSAIKDAKQRKGFMDSFKAGFNEAMLKEQLAKNLNVIPEKGVKIGDTWTQTENVSPDGAVKLTTTYQLMKVENGIAEISIKGGIPLKSNKQTQQGMTHTASMEGSQNGTISLDTNTGWMQNSNLNVKTTQKESLSDGKKTQTITKVSNSSLVINPKK
ncbi:MAG: hypothetical protein KBA33_06150 [Cloacibacterium sp.]|nr:hypothetical protein [Cloacibacterium sp.]